MTTPVTDAQNDLLYAIENMEAAVRGWSDDDLARPHMALILEAARRQCAAPPVTDVREMVRRYGIAVLGAGHPGSSDYDDRCATDAKRLWEQITAALESLSSQLEKARGEARTTYEALRDPNHRIRVRGVGRISDEPRALLLALTERPTDDEIRALHDFFSQRPMLEAIRALHKTGEPK